MAFLCSAFMLILLHGGLDTIIVAILFWTWPLIVLGIVIWFIRKRRSNRSAMKAGSKVRLIGIPDGLENYPDPPTKSTFLKCVGHEFIVAGFNEVGMAEINIESVTGSLGEAIWIEPKFLELLSK